jgi:hypothetical protein
MRIVSQPCHPMVRAQALLADGAAARGSGELDRAVTSLVASQELHAQLGMHSMVALCVVERSKAVLAQGDADAARELAAQAVDIAERSGDAWAAAYARDHMSASVTTA